MGHIETSYSDANHDVWNGQNDRWGLGPTETSISAANNAVFHEQNDRWDIGPIDTCNFDPKVAVLNAKTTEDGWDP